ncbi:MAG TPA: SRPBCC family protein, partial [Solirubrobacteraceae bacterium]|nr:SRPBCC family protein [Solirubrobacteraceae bacterium]
MRTRQFHGEARADVAAPLDECFTLLAAVDRYPEWCPDVVRQVQVLEYHAGGQPRLVRMMIHVARGTLVKEFHLLLAIAVDEPRSVTLTRETDHPTNQEFTAVWLLRPDRRTCIALELDARLRVPALVPAGGIPDEIADAFVVAASRALAAPPHQAGH